MAHDTDSGEGTPTPNKLNVVFSGKAVIGGEAPEPIGEMEQYVTLDQMAATVSRSKKTLERWLCDGKIPPPDVKGGGGKPHEWKWSRIRIPLEEHSGKTMPKRFPRLRQT